MSVKNNSFVLVAAATLSISAGAIGAPVIESLLNDYTVSALQAAQIEPNGRIVVFATVTAPGASTSEIRPVAASSGDVRLFGGIGALESVVKKAKLSPGANMTVIRMDKTGAVGDPIASLKTQFKQFKAEKAAGVKYLAVSDAKKVAATALGWDTQTGTPEAAEYADYVQKSAGLNELVSFAQIRIDSLAASLTAAGIDPATIV